MKVEHFPDGLEGRPMILLSGGTPDEVKELRASLRPLVQASGRELLFNDLPFVESVGQCRVIAISSDSEVGVKAMTSGQFQWEMHPHDWLTVEGLLEPFSKEATSIGFQYLNAGDGPEVIYSADGTW